MFDNPSQSLCGPVSKVARRFASTLKEEGDRAVLSYWTAFFRSRDMQYLSERDVDLVRDHLLARCRTSPSRELFTAMEGIGAHLKKGQISRFVDPLMRLATASSELSEDAKATLAGEYSRTDDETDKLISKRLETWIETFNSREQPDKAAIAEEIKSTYDNSVPF